MSAGWPMGFSPVTAAINFLYRLNIFSNVVRVNKNSPSVFHAVLSLLNFFPCFLIDCRQLISSHTSMTSVVHWHRWRPCISSPAPRYNLNSWTWGRNQQISSQRCVGVAQAPPVGQLLPQLTNTIPATIAMATRATRKNLLFIENLLKLCLSAKRTKKAGRSPYRDLRRFYQKKRKKINYRASCKTRLFS